MWNGKIAAIVFDFDGTLAESCLDFSEMKRRLSSLALEYLPSLRGQPNMPALEWMQVLAVEIGRVKKIETADFLSRAASLILDMELAAASQGSLFPFSRPMLLSLKEQRIKTAIITRNCTEAVRVVFPDLHSYCNCLLTRDHVERVKPHPDHLLHAIEAIYVSPRCALMVGDHPLDIETGKRAGVRTAGVWSGKASRADLIDSGADWVAANCEELMQILEAQAIIGLDSQERHKR
jgi:phosphoglycolate phosphatase